jgi:hypothetical protein
MTANDLHYLLADKREFRLITVSTEAKKVIENPVQIQ